MWYTVFQYLNARVRELLRKTVIVHIPNEHLNNAATFFIKKANEFTSHITASRENNSVNAKSLLGVLSLGIVQGTVIQLIADGPDAEEAVEALAELLSGDFGE